MTRTANILLLEILEAIRLIQEYASGVSLEAFREDTEKQDAVIRRIEIIGEAVKGLPLDLRDRYSDIPWHKIAETRNILIHEYFRVDVVLAWEMVQKELPRLAATVERMIRDES